MPILTEFVARPDSGGKAGKSIQVMTNVFPMKFEPLNEMYQYDITITPELGIEDSKRIWNQLEREIARDMCQESVKFAFDGKKNAYSSTNIDKKTITVEFDRNSPPIIDYPLLPPPQRFPQFKDGQNRFRGGMGRGNSNRGGHQFSNRFNNSPSRQEPVPARAEVRNEALEPDMISVKIAIKQTASINLQSLRDILDCKRCDDDCITHSVTAISAVLRHMPSFNFISFGQNFFSPTDRVALSGGLEIWRGFHQSIKVMRAGHLGVNVDIAATVFRRGKAKLIDLIMEVVRVESPMELSRIRDLREKILSEFKGSNLIMSHVPGRKIRFKVTGVSPKGANQFTFKGPNGEVTVEKHFRDQYGITLQYPGLPLILKGKSSAIPLELLTIAPSQRFLKRLNPDQISDMIRATIVKPRERLDIIHKAAEKKLFFKSSNPYLNIPGCKIDTTPMKIPARVLDAPNVMFSKTRGVSGRDGVWKIQGMVVRPMKLHSFAFAFFANVDRESENTIIRTILRGCYDIGVKVDADYPRVPVISKDPRSQMDVKRALMDVASQAAKEFKFNCQLIFCVVKRGAKIGYTSVSLYEEIKRITLTEMDVLSQCMAVDRVARGRVNRQYAENLALKVNIKLGGATNEVDNIPLFDVPTQLFGADVTHPGVASVAPSVAAVVASVDPAGTRYYTYLRAQESRKEIIDDMQTMASQALDAFHKHNNCYPSRIIFFRDGVSSGQFKEVKSSELNALKKALAGKSLLESTKITFIIVQKRHHVRFFPYDGVHDRSGNCLPGTVVDNSITHPVEFNFYLQSHAGIQGTSRPTLYHVIHDENKIGSDCLQRLCYNLCFLSERSTRSISMVAPAYRAHIAAFMGKMFLDSEADFSDSASIATGNSKGTPVIALRPVKKCIDEKTMYYM